MDTTSELAVRASATVPLPPMQRGRSQSTAGELDPGVRWRAWASLSPTPSRTWHPWVLHPKTWCSACVSTFVLPPIRLRWLPYRTRPPPHSRCEQHDPLCLGWLLALASLEYGWEQDLVAHLRGWALRIHAGGPGSGWCWRGGTARREGWSGSGATGGRERWRRDRKKRIERNNERFT